MQDKHPFFSVNLRSFILHMGSSNGVCKNYTKFKALLTLFRVIQFWSDTLLNKMDILNWAQ